MINTIGYIGAFLFAFCAAPEAYKCYKDGYSNVSKIFMWMWLLGEILMSIYVIQKHGFDMPLLWNYWLNTVFVLVIMKYLYFPRVKAEPFIIRAEHLIKGLD